MFHRAFPSSALSAKSGSTFNAINDDKNVFLGVSVKRVFPEMIRLPPDATKNLSFTRRRAKPQIPLGSVLGFCLAVFSE